jgi:hypothetical protein
MDSIRGYSKDVYIEAQGRLRAPKETWECIQYASLCFRENIPLIHIPNEGKRSKETGYLLKKMGLLPGTPDYFHPIVRGGYGGLWIEMKRNKAYSASERSTDSWGRQVNMLVKLRRYGFMAEMAYGWEHARKIRQYYMSLPKPEIQLITALGPEFDHPLNPSRGTLSA